MPDTPADRLPARHPPATPSGVPSSPSDISSTTDRPFRRMGCTFHRTRRAPTFPAFQARQAALLPHAPDARPPVDAPPRPRLRRIRHRSPETSCRRRAVSRHPSRLRNVLHPRARERLRSAPKSLTLHWQRRQKRRAPNERFRPRTKDHEKTREKAAPERATLPRVMRQKAKMPSARCCRSARPARASTRRLWTRPDSECADCANRGSAAPAIFPPQ